MWLCCVYVVCVMMWCVLMRWLYLWCLWLNLLWVMVFLFRCMVVGIILLCKWLECIVLILCWRMGCLLYLLCVGLIDLLVLVVFGFVICWWVLWLLCWIWFGKLVIGFGVIYGKCGLIMCLYGWWLVVLGWRKMLYLIVCVMWWVWCCVGIWLFVLSGCVVFW